MFFCSHVPVLTGGSYLSVIDMSSTTVSTRWPRESLSAMLPSATLGQCSLCLPKKQALSLTGPQPQLLVHILARLPLPPLQLQPNFSTHAPTSIPGQVPRPKCSLLASSQLCGKPHLCWQPNFRLSSLTKELQILFHRQNPSLFHRRPPRSTLNYKQKHRDMQRLPTVWQGWEKKSNPKRLGQQWAEPVLWNCVKLVSCLSNGGHSGTYRRRLWPSKSRLLQVKYPHVFCISSKERKR